MCQYAPMCDTIICKLILFSLVGNLPNSLSQVHHCVTQIKEHGDKRLYLLPHFMGSANYHLLAVCRSYYTDTTGQDSRNGRQSCKKTIPCSTGKCQLSISFPCATFCGKVVSGKRTQQAIRPREKLPSVSARVSTSRRLRFASSSPPLSNHCCTAGPASPADDHGRSGL